MKAASFFETSADDFPTTQRNNPEDLLPQQSRGGSPRSPFFSVNNNFLGPFLSGYFIFRIHCVLLMYD
jgi:hypothetical protein